MALHNAGSTQSNAALTTVAPPTTVQPGTWHEGIILKDAGAVPTYDRIWSAGTWKESPTIQVNWAEETTRPMTDTTNDAALAAVTTATWMTVDNVARWRTNVMARNRTSGEMVKATQVDQTNNRVYLGERGAGSVAAAGISDDSTWELYVSKRDERSTMIPATSDIFTMYYNYQMFISDSMDMSQFMINVGRSNSIKTDMYKHIKSKKTYEFKKNAVAWFYRGERNVENAGTAAVNYQSGGMMEWLNNSPSNWNFGGGMLTKGELLDAIMNAHMTGRGMEYDCFMRPEIYGEVIKMLDVEVNRVDLVANQKLDVQSFSYHGVKLNFHSEYVLADIGVNNIFGFQTGSKLNRGSKVGIEFHYSPCRGGTKVTSGKPEWIADQQDNSESVKAEQIVANYCPIPLGHSWGGHFMLQNIANMNY